MMVSFSTRLALFLGVANSMVHPAAAQDPFQNPTTRLLPPSSWPDRPPARIYVQPFHLDPQVAANLANDDSPIPKGPFRKAAESRPRVVDVFTGNDRKMPIGQSIAKLVAKNLTDNGLPVVFWMQPGPPPQNGWNLTGQIVALDEGHKVAQNVVGFGVGNKKVAVDVAISDPFTGGGQPFFLVDTSDKGRKMPGTAPVAAIAGFNPVAVATQMVASNSGMKDISQQHKIASEISGEVIAAMKAHGQYRGK